MRHTTSTWDTLVDWNGELPYPYYQPGLGPILIPVPYEGANCDPSVIRFGNIYYMAYSGYNQAYNYAHPDPAMGGTINFIARSVGPEGPFLKWTGTDWLQNPAQPKPIVTPISINSASRYGAGQPSLVVMWGDVVYQWYTDASENGTAKIYLLVSWNMTNWFGVDGVENAPILNVEGFGTNALDDVSVDVKFDDASQQFVMHSIQYSETPDARLIKRYSSDGVHWGSRIIVCGNGSVPQCNFPKYGHNVGISGDDQGHLEDVTKPIIAAFGAPYNLSNTNNRPNWNLYKMIVPR